LIRRSFAGRTHLFDCTRSNPPRVVPVDLTLGDDFVFVFNASRVRPKCFVDPLNPPRLPDTLPMIKVSNWQGTLRTLTKLFIGPLSSLICLIGCSRNTTNLAHETSLINAKLLSLSGRGGFALNCGSVGISQNPHSASGCALRAFANKSPFYVRYKLQGIDSEVSAGLAGDSAGNVYFLEYDSMGWETGALSKGAEVTNGKHIYVEPCPKPVTLRKTRTGRLTCAKSAPSASHDIMSPTFDPY